MTTLIINEDLQFAFSVDIGEESIHLPREFRHPVAVWLIDLRQRPMYLACVPSEQFDTLGLRYYTSTAETPVHLRGLSIYYKIEDGKMFFWPVPAHRWRGIVQRAEENR